MLGVLFLSALALSILMCATPGALNTEALRRGVEGGFKRAIRIELGSCIGDLTWAALALIGLAFLVENDTMRIALGIGGAVLLLYLAFDSFRSAKRNEMPKGAENGRKGDFVTGALISLGNPFQLAFWVGIGGSTIATVAPNPEGIHFLVFFLGYTTGLVVFSFVYSALIAYGRKYITPSLFQAINVICGAVLIYFALNLLWSTFFA
ncbi:MAG: LysE family transporter [Methanomassiliicoccales archaeon]|jgi:threonine/homoserine/homoserine lactone efflux protein